MNQPKRILVVEIKTMNNPNLDSSQLFTIRAFNDSKRLHLSSDIEPIKLAILDAIVHLNSNYRHPLLFNVQVLPGNEMNAFMALGDNPPRTGQRARRTKK